MARTQADKNGAAASDAKEGRVSAAAGKDRGWGRLSCLGNRPPRCWKVKWPPAAVCLVWRGWRQPATPSRWL